METDRPSYNKFPFSNIQPLDIGASVLSFSQDESRRMLQKRRKHQMTSRSLAIQCKIAQELNETNTILKTPCPPAIIFLVAPFSSERK